MLVLFGLRSARAGWRVGSWPVARGVILKCDVIEVSGSSADAEHRNRRFHLDLEYRFDVDGVAVEGTRLRFGTLIGTNDPAWAREIKQRYPAETEVDVHYDPKNPQRCALEVGTKGGLLIGPSIGFVLMLLGWKLLAW